MGSRTRFGYQSKVKTLDRLLSDNNFVRSLIDSLPCGLLIVDSQSRVQAVNNVFESILGINKQAVLGKGPGDALRCLHVSDHPGGCGFGENCGQCDARQLVLTAVSARQKQRKKVYLEVLVDGQVMDLTLLFNAVPFTFHNKEFSILLIEDIGRLKLFRSAETADGFRGIIGHDGQ
jgi:PAS domain-containing protein